MKLYKCPPANIVLFGNSQWWCGDPWVTLPCTGDDAHFFNYTSGSFSTALAPSSLSSAVKTSAKPETLSLASSTQTLANVAAAVLTTTSAALTNHSSTSAALSDQDQPQSSKLPTALGAGIGSAFGIVILACCLVFLYMRRKKLQDRRNSTSTTHESKKVDVEGPTMELHDTERAHELDSIGRNEMSGTRAKIVPVF